MVLQQPTTLSHQSLIRNKLSHVLLQKEGDQINNNGNDMKQLMCKFILKVLQATFSIQYCFVLLVVG